MVSYKTAVLSIVMMTVLMSAVDTTIVLLALPTITEKLHTDLSLSIWVILVYLLVLAIMTTQMGSISDNFGRKKLYLLGIGVFTVGSLFSGLSTTIYFLIGARVVQGIGAAMIQGNSSAIIADNFDINERGKAYGFTSLGWNIGGTLGIVLGGVITTFIGWSYIFFINVPIGVVAIAIGIRAIREGKRAPKEVDLVGVGYLGVLLSLIAYGAIEITSVGLNTVSEITIPIGILMIFPFIHHERRTKNPIINMEAFRVRGLSFSLTATFFQALGYLAVVFIVIMYLQGIRGFTPLYSSLILVPGYVVASLLAPLMGSLSDRFGQRLFATLGILLMGLGITVYLTLHADSPIYYVILGSVISGIGGSMFWPSNNSAVMRYSPRNIYGSTSGLMRTLSNIGTVMSFVVTLTIASAVIPRYIAFEVFVGLSSHLIGDISTKLLYGLKISMVFSILILLVAAVFSFLRGSSSSKNAGKPLSAGKK